MTMTTTIQKKTALITGCNSSNGIGWALAISLSRRGYHVFATTHNQSTSSAPSLPELPNIETHHLDVTSPQSISACKDIVSKRTGDTLDILVNNAGIEFQSPLLDVDIDAAKKLYDVNVWGPLAVTQVFAPLLVAAKGVVVNQSSIDAVLNMAWAGIYASSKAAIARLSDTLRVELDPLGVRVVTVMCGSAKTPFFDKPGGRMKLSESSYYYEVQETAYKERMDHKEKAIDVHTLTEKLARDIVGGASGQIWHGAMAGMVKYMTGWCPTWLVDKLVNGERGINRAKGVIA